MTVLTKLNPKIEDFLKTKKFKKATEAQIKSIPDILSGKNVLLIAPTGLGKTEAALLPVLNNFLKIKENISNKNKGISILYITPLRALNRDMLKRTIELGKYIDIDISVRHGDTTKKERARQSKNPPDMLITTPETFQIMFTGKRLRKHLEIIKFVIIDEIHELAGNERGGQLSVALERLEELTEKNNHSFQRIGLSATVGSPKEVAKFLAGVKNNKFREVKTIKVDVTKRIDIKVEYPKIKKDDCKNAKKLYIEPISFACLRRSKELIEKHVSTLLFINTRDGAEILASRFNMWKKNLEIGVHHGSLSKVSRVESEEDFKKGKLKSLICTSSLELGIDVGNTDYVIQYNSPREVKRIIQRVGRSGHSIEKTSKGMILASHPEDLAESMVIARKALKGEIEELKIRKNPLSVLTNQIISIALEYKKIKKEKIFQIIRRSYPFYELKKDLFEKTLDQLKKQRSIWIDDENQYISKRRYSRHYFLDNISMIPDEKTFTVLDISTRKKIGKLDESFVLNSGFEGTSFILRGRPWNIVKIEEDEILVAQSEDAGNIPSWTGEDIPVPYNIAREVGRIRSKNSEEHIFRNYPVNKDSAKKFKKYIEKQKKQDFKIPDDKTITIEVEDKTIVINACFGTKVNETLGRLISAMLVQSIGESVGINSDSYRINLELPERIKPQKIEEILKKTKPESLWYILNRILRNSNYIRWQLVHVARKFGAIKKDFDYKKVGAKKIFGLFDNTLIKDEAVDKIIFERMDVENTKEVLKQIQKDEIKIVVQRLSPISVSGYETIKGLMVPKHADRTILLALKKRLEESDITLVCTNCKHLRDTTARRVEEKPKCPRCGAIKIAVLRRYNKNKANVLSKKSPTEEEKKEIKRLHKNASLVLSYGKNAIFALSGRGIGPDTAARILRKYNPSDLKKIEEDEIKFLKDILKAELTYARTRGFWDN